MAGSWAALQPFVGRLHEEWKPDVGVGYEFTADASDGSIPDKESEDVSGALVAVAVAYDGTTPPNATTITIKDQLGVTIISEAMTASGYMAFDKPIWFVPGAVTISVSGNTTNSAKAKIVMVFT